MKAKRMAISRHLLAAIVSLIGLLCLQHAATARQEEVLEFKLESGIYRSCTAIIGSDRALFQWGATCFLLIPPDYDVLFLVNHDNKSFLKQSIAEFMLTKWERKKFGKVTALKKAGTKNILGYSCRQYECLVDGRPLWFATTDSIKVNPRVLNAACRLLEVPQDCGVPMHAKRLVTYHDKAALSNGRQIFRTRNSVTPWLFVNSIKKRMIDDSKLRLAKDYRVAKSDFDLMFSKDGRARQSDLEDFFMSGH